MSAHLPQSRRHNDHRGLPCRFAPRERCVEARGKSCSFDLDLPHIHNWSVSAKRFNRQKSQTSQNVAESTQLPNNKESAESKSSKFDSPTTTTTTHEIAIGPDFRSVDLFQKAMQAAADGQSQKADKLFRESIESLKLRQNDSAFEAKIFKKYADFLRDNNREKEANSLIQEAEEVRKKHQEQIELIWGSPPDSRSEITSAQNAKNKSPQPNRSDVLNGTAVEPSILEERHYSQGRAERAQRTSPTLPEGKPIPDNE